MKKYLLSLILLALFGVKASAQFTLGVKGGLVISKLNTDNFASSTATGYDVGLFARIGQTWYVQPEAYISSKGSEFTFQAQNNTVTETGKQHFTTLDVPILVGRSFGASSFNIRVMAGPVVSYVFNEDNNFSTNVKNAYNAFSLYNKAAIGYQAGVGIDLGNVSLDARYEGALTDINSHYGERPNLFQLSLGFKIL